MFGSLPPPMAYLSSLFPASPLTSSFRFHTIVTPLRHDACLTWTNATLRRFHRTVFIALNNNMFILRTAIDLALTGPERTENLSMLHSLISLTPSHPLINPLSGLRLRTHR